jgi:enoyl-CoA hydratase/carnithine racemase
MVRAVVSRVVPRERISKAMARESAAEAARRAALAVRADAPDAVNRVPTRAAARPEGTGAFIRPLGNSRRVFLLDPHLEAEELEGLAHRIQVLSKNEGINSVLIATDDKDDAANDCLPRFLSEWDQPNLSGIDLDNDPKADHTWHVSGGYDPVAVADEKDEDQRVYLLDNIQKLTLATKGHPSETRVPVITMPHGVVTDAGYSLCMGSYVLATRQTSFRILNPSRGLSLDPVGFSYLLPRLGWEYRQRSSKYTGIGMILALTGYEANCYDMVETGLATHLVNNSSALPLLERSLSALPPYNQQELVEKPKHYYGQPRPRDANAAFRNMAVGHTIEALTEYSADASNSLPFDYTSIDIEDPALDTDQVPWDSGFFSSDLVDYGATFDKIFKQEKSLEGLMERFREIGARESDDPDEQECSQVAQDLVNRMELQSPLALRVVHQLMTLGAGRQATLENCMEREKKVQLKLFQKDDYQNWAKWARKNGGKDVSPFTSWKHDSVAAVSAEEIDEILS